MMATGATEDGPGQVASGRHRVVAGLDRDRKCQPATGLRVLFANHNGRGPEGGGGKVLTETMAAVRDLGVEAECTTELCPSVRDFDLVHAFNVWPPDSAQAQMRHLRDANIPVVWEPIFSDLYEFAWAKRAIQVLARHSVGSPEWHDVLAQMEAGTLEVEGMARWRQNEIWPGYLAAAAEMFAIATHVSVCSLHEIGMLTRNAPGVHTPFTVIPHGVDADFFANGSPDAFVTRFGVRDFILSVGHIEPRKNQLMLIEAARDLDRPIVLAGPTHPVDREYMELCQARGGDNVIFTGAISRELVASAYKAAAVHALPSFAEGSALSTMEAAAAGCEIVASNRASELEYYGDLVRTCDPVAPKSIRAAIEHALARPFGDRLAEHMRRFPWSLTGQLTLGAYKRTMNHVATQIAEQ